MRKYYFLLLLFLASGAFAQDIHFSQYYASPLTLNPAMTGNVNGVLRAAAIYRNQFFSIPTANSVAPFQTYQASVDAPLLRERLGNDAFGVGGMAYGDRAGDGALTTICATASIAYHKAVDRYGKARIGLGLMAGLAQKTINVNSLIFENQLDNQGWNKSLFNGESNFSNKAILIPQVSLGLMFQHAATKTFHYYAGFSLWNISRPRESFLQNSKNRLPMRFIVHGAMEIFLNEQFSLSPTFAFMLQSTAQQFNFGLGLNYSLNDNVDLLGGVFARVNDAHNTDAVVLSIGTEVYNARIGFSYDITVSTLKVGNKSQGGPELSLIYIFKKEKPGDTQYEKYCPRF